MRILDLKGGRVVIDDADAEAVNALTVYVGSNGYAYYSKWENGKSSPKTLHSFLMGHHPGMHIDHINGNKLDNRRCNLRVVTPQQNQLNRHRPDPRNTSGYKGVTRRVLRSGEVRWIAQIGTTYLGTFSTIEEAAQRRAEAEAQCVC